MSSSLERVKARIRALLAKTVANGCTEGEALAAAEKAVAMLRDHDLTADELQIGTASSHSTRSRRHPLDDLLPLIAFACRCKVLLAREQGCPLEYLFTGHLPWPEVATWLRDTLDAAHRRALRAYLKSPEYGRRRNPRTRALARRHFTAGFVDVVKTKLAKLASPDLESIRAELDLVGRAVRLPPGCVSKVRPLSRPRMVPGAAADRAAGWVAGRQTQVSWGVRGEAPGRISISPETLNASTMAAQTQSQTTTLVASLAAVQAEIAALRPEVAQDPTTAAPVLD